MNKPNPAYEAVIVDHMLLDGKAVGKFYAAEILGREDHSREWKYSGLDFREVKQGLEAVFAQRDDARIPRIVIAMPHVSRVYLFGNPDEPTQRETNIHAELYDSRTCIRKPLREIGCDGEIAILGAERKFWNEALTVEEYLRRLVPKGSLGKVANPNKLFEFLSQ